MRDNFDSSIPARLLELQHWFTNCITHPLGSTKRSSRNKARTYILPSSTLNPEQRVTIYQQQYWWRLLRILQNTYPALSRLFGTAVFNETIAIPYLLKYPSKTWDLNLLGRDLPKWVSKEYHEDDKTLILSMAEIDRAFEESFLAATLPPLQKTLAAEDASKLLTQKIVFQPHVKIFQLPFHLFHLREQLLQESIEYWEAHPFPNLAQEKTYHFILYRNRRNRVVWKEIQHGAWVLIELIQDGHTLQQACSKLEKLGGIVEEEAENYLALWLHHWVEEGLLAKKPRRSL